MRVFIAKMNYAPSEELDKILPCALNVELWVSTQTDQCLCWVQNLIVGVAIHIEHAHISISQGGDSSNIYHKT